MNKVENGKHYEQLELRLVAIQIPRQSEPPLWFGFFNVVLKDLKSIHQSI